MRGCFEGLEGEQSGHCGRNGFPRTGSCVATKGQLLGDGRYRTLRPLFGIHVDLRSEAEQASVDARGLVNNDHPPRWWRVWNLVFIKYNRKTDGSLEALPAKHVDTGMGFRAPGHGYQGSSRIYDTDVFSPLLNKIAEIAGLPYTNRYGHDTRSDMAIRVITDHVRAVSFAIADGNCPPQQSRLRDPADPPAGRTVCLFLPPYQGRPSIDWVPILAGQMARWFLGLAAQEAFVSQVILEEGTVLPARTLEGVGNDWTRSRITMAYSTVTLPNSMPTQFPDRPDPSDRP